MERYARNKISGVRIRDTGFWYWIRDSEYGILVPVYRRFFVFLILGLPQNFAFAVDPNCLPHNLENKLGIDATFESDLRSKLGPIILSDEDLGKPWLVKAAISLRRHLEGLDGMDGLQPYQRELLKEVQRRHLKIGFGDRAVADFKTGTAVVDRSVARNVPEKLNAYARHELTHLVYGHDYNRFSPPAEIFLSELEANLQGEAKSVRGAYDKNLQNNYGGALMDAYGSIPSQPSPAELSKIIRTLCGYSTVDRSQFPNICR